MEDIQIGKNFTTIVPIPESQGSDTVTYIIYKASDSSVFGSGSATYVAGINWKLSFIPNVSDIFIVEVSDQTLDVKYSQSFRVPLTDIPGDICSPSLNQMLVVVNKAIYDSITSGTVQAYTLAGRNIQYRSLQELYNVRDRIVNEINALKGPARNVAGYHNNTRREGIWRNWS